MVRPSAGDRRRIRRRLGASWSRSSPRCCSHPTRWIRGLGGRRHGHRIARRADHVVRITMTSPLVIRTHSRSPIGVTSRVAAVPVRVAFLLDRLRRHPLWVQVGPGDCRVGGWESLAPAGIARRPAELTPGLRVGGTTPLRRHDDHGLAGDQPRQPGGEAPGRFGAEVPYDTLVVAGGRGGISRDADSVFQLLRRSRRRVWLAVPSNAC
jgi:hypothetical protein